MDPTESEEEAVPSAATKSLPPEATPNEPASLSESIDPIAIGGAVGGMTVGEVIGGAIGGVLGAVAGPGGAVIGAGLGAFAGTTLGAKLGYDVTHELVHPEDSHPNASLGERARALARTTAGNAGDAVAGGIGASGGALVGTVLAGPLGGKVGSFVGEAIAGELGTERATVLYAKAERLAANPHEAEQTLEAKTEFSPPSKAQWLANVASETAGETGLAATFGALGGLVAGKSGRKLGRRAGTTLAKHLNWASPFSRKRQPPTQTQADTEGTEGSPKP